jgi:predicted DCC family thiol-disulfide oxidoreductase YuxK
MTVSPESWRIAAYFDGDCPLCVREMRALQRLDRKRGRIHFIDIAAPDFAPPPERSLAELMDRIHARLPDGRLVEGVEVFRQLYAAVGFGPLVWVTRAPGVSRLLDLAYRWFAKHRLRLTGRCDPAGGAGGCRLARPPRDQAAA